MARKTRPGMCLSVGAPDGHVICLKGSGTERKCGSYHAAWSPGRIREKCEGEVASAKNQEGEVVFAGKLGVIRAWPLGPPGLRLCPIVIREGVNNSSRLRTRTPASSTRAVTYSAWLLAWRRTTRAVPRLRKPVHGAARRHLPQHFIWCQRVARDQVTGARQTFQTQTQRKLQGHWRAARIDDAHSGAHQNRGTAQSLARGTRVVALKQFHRYFVQNELLQRSDRVAWPDPRQRHDSCLCSA
jgi:hypothetical protein